MKYNIGVQKFWFEKIPFIKQSKHFFEKLGYEDINLWPVMAGEVYTYYQPPEKVWWRKIAMIFKCIFTLDRFDISGKRGNIFASFIMARDDHHLLVEKALEKFPKKDLTILDACEYKKKESPLKFSYHFPDLFLLLRIWNKFRKFNMKKVLGENKYYFFIARTYFRCKQISQFQKIYEKYKPRAYISFCSQAFPEEGIMTLICKKYNVPTFTMQHGFIIKYDIFSPTAVLNENLISDYQLIWGNKTYNFLKNYIDKSKLLVVGNPKYSNIKINSLKKFRPKGAVIFLSVIGFNESNHNLIDIINRFALKNPEIKFTIKIHPFDEIKNYTSQIDVKNIEFVEKNVLIGDILERNDFVIMHNTSVSMEALHYQIPLFSYSDKYSWVPWKNNDKFRNLKEFEKMFNLLKKDVKMFNKWKAFYKREFKKEFYQPREKSVSQKYYDVIMEIVNSIK